MPRWSYQSATTSPIDYCQYPAVLLSRDTEKDVEPRILSPRTLAAGAWQPPKLAARAQPNIGLPRSAR